MSRRTKKQKIEFSKLILYVVGAVTVGVTAFTLIMVWKTENLEPLAYLIPAIFAELATATGFYYSKAKAENRIKLRKLYGPEIYNHVINFHKMLQALLSSFINIGWEPL